MTENKDSGARYQFYGMKVAADDIVKFIETNIELNEEAEKNGDRKGVVCIWGHPGLGKTQIVKDFGKKNDVAVIDIPIAQFEESGDLHGLPLISTEGNEAVTKTAPPEWVEQAHVYAREGKKVIILFDDFNRADLRILKAIMQLLQDYRMVSWGLPKGSTIVLTGNPDGGDHLVSTLDSAQLTRMKHITMEPDVKRWAYWAETHGVDSRGMNFLLCYEEFLATGDMTNPRSWVEAFKILKKYPDLVEESEAFRIVEMHVRSAIDNDSATAFLTFLFKGLDEIIEPETILEKFTEDEDVKKTLQKYIDSKRQDILSVITERLFVKIANPKFNPKGKDKEKYSKNLCAFLKMGMPEDLRYSVVQRICHDKTYGENNSQQLLTNDPELLQLVMDVTD